LTLFVEFETYALPVVFPTEPAGMIVTSLPTATKKNRLYPSLSPLRGNRSQRRRNSISFQRGQINNNVGK